MNTSHAPSSVPKPWYRQFWPWFVLAWPAAAVVGGFATLLIAAHHPDALVADDYYQAGLAINQDLARQQRAVALELTGILRRDPQARRLTIALIHNDAWVQPQTLELELIHPTQPNLDRTILLQREAADRWSARSDIVIHGRWQLNLTPANAEWRLQGRLRIPHEYQAHLQPTLD